MTSPAASTLNELIAFHSAAAASSSAVVIPDSAGSGTAATLTYSQFEAEIAKTKIALVRAGIKPGDVVSIVMPNTLAYLTTFLAVTWARATAAPLNMVYKKDNFLFYMKDTATKALIIPKSLTEDHECLAAANEMGIPIWTCESDGSGVVTLIAPALEGEGSVSEEAAAAVSPVEADKALFLHTSGTTSLPKGVPLTHKNLLTSLKNIVATYKLSPADRSLIVMPLFHVHGLLGGTLSSLLAGGSVVIPLKFSASSFWTTAKSHSCTWYTAVSTIHSILLLRANAPEAVAGESYYPGLFRFIRSCSASLAPSVLNGVVATFKAPVLEAYGMTEASHQMSSNPLPENGVAKIGSVGLPSNVKVSIRQEAEDVAVAVDVLGEVCIQGDNVTLGYHNRPEANASCFTASGWFRTGDQGYLDSDGYLFLTGRLKELINRGGEKISPVEVDGVLLANPNLQDAVTFSYPHTIYGEEVACAVVAKEGVTVTQEEVIAHCAASLSAFTVPTKVFLADSFPRTSTGKIQRRIVSAHFQALEKEGK